MKTDISNNDDVKIVLQDFYNQVKNDPVIGFFFSDVVPVHWESHIEKMCSFWESILFFTGPYEGSPLITHRYVNKLHATTPEHFERWLTLFDATVDNHFAGPNATKMKQHSKAVAAVLLKNI